MLNVLSIRRIVISLLVLTLILSGTSTPAKAMDIPVTCDIVHPAPVLIAAIIAAEANPGPDTLILSADCVYSIPIAITDTALPAITSPIKIVGNGATIRRDAISLFQYRLFYVQPGGSLELVDVNLSGGYHEYGGAINNDGTLTIVNSSIYSNDATPGVAKGGAITNSGMLTVTNSSIYSNSTGSGGGIYNNGGTVSVLSSSIYSNGSSYAGGIYNNGGAVSVINSSVWGNGAQYEGGGLYNYTGNMTVVNSIVSGNGATNYGGGFYMHDGAVTVSSSTFAWNSSGTGSDMHVNSGSLIVTNSIVRSSASPISGTGTVTYSNIQGGYTGAGNIDADPLFVDAVGGNYHLQANSPSLNVGSNVGLPADTHDLDGDSDTTEPLPVDGEGNSRVVNATVDMGVFEHQTAAGVVVSKTAVSVVEGGATDTYTMHLASRPGLGVTITPTGDTQCTVSGPLVFTPDDWATPKTVTVTAENDAIDEDAHGCVVTNAAVSLDAAYNGISVAGLTGTVTDNDTAGIAINPADAHVSEVGLTDTYTVALTSLPASNVTVAIATGGQTTVDPTELTFTPADWGTPQTVTVTAVDDAVVEGTHADTITHTAASADALYDEMTGPSVGVTIDEEVAAASELLDNGDFESSLDGWTVKNKTGDKLNCKPGKPHTGLCAFKFAGGAGENAQLTQTVDLTGVTFETGETMALSAWFKGNNATAKTQMVLIVIYTGNPTPVQTKLIVKRNPAYTQHALPDYALTSGAVDQIKVTFKHKSTAGCVLIDDVSLIHTTLSGRRTILPLPSVPEGFRGGN